MNITAGRVVPYLKMIRFSHSVFALPFALTGAILAAQGLPSPEQIFWIAVAMVSARSGAMGMNRIADREIDALNPRTKNREIPAGTITVREASFFTAVSFAILVIAAYNLNPLCFMLSPVAIAILIFYSFTKRFTCLSHIVLGIAISGAPLGAWIAVRGTADAGIVPLTLAVVFWLAGFDVLYALQDVSFDREHGLHSIPRRFGIPKALAFSRVLHAMTFAFLCANGYIFGLGPFYWAGMVVVGGLLIYEHSLVSPNDLSRLNMAFFNMNGYISIAVFLCTALAVI